MRRALRGELVDQLFRGDSGQHYDQKDYSENTLLRRTRGGIRFIGFDEMKMVLLIKPTQNGFTVNSPKPKANSYYVAAGDTEKCVILRASLVLFGTFCCLPLGMLPYSQCALHIYVATALTGGVTI